MAAVAQTPEQFDLGAGPDSAGRVGKYGGRFVPEALMAALEELDAAYRVAIAAPGFVAE